MKIKLSKIILIVSVVGTILVGICLANIYKTDIVVNDVYGDRKELGDMNILLQKTGGVFETDAILVNKNGESINKFAKQGSQLLNLTKENIDNRYLFQFEHDGNLLFEDEITVGMANVSPSTIIDNKEKMAANIEIKDKKSGKIESYEIEAGESINTNKNYRYDSLPVKKEGDILYVVVMYSYYNYPSGEEYVDDSKLLSKYCESTNLSLYKLNLVNKTSKCVISKDYEDGNLNLKKSAFSNENKSYFVVDKKDDKSDTYETNLLEFDIKTKEINFINLGTKDDYITRACTIENDEILLISMPMVDGYISDITEDVKGILVDLKNRNLKNTYKLDMKYGEQPVYTNRLRTYNGKIYAVSAGYIDTDKYGQTYSSPYTFYVFDENNGEKLYEGNIEINSNYRVNMGIVTNDEIE